MNDRDLATLLRASHAPAGEAGRSVEPTVSERRLPGCPPADQLLALAGWPLAAAERLRLETHVASCPSCTAELELAAMWNEPVDANDPDVAFVVGQLRGSASGRTLTAAAPAAELNRDPARRGPHHSDQGAAAVGTGDVLPWRSTATRDRARRPGRSVLALAATLVAGIGVAWLVANGGVESRPPALPPPPLNDVMRGVTLTALSPRGELVAAPTILHFEAVDAGADVASYRVTLLRVDGTLLWESFPAVGGELPLPGEVVVQLLPAVTYRWQVEARDPAGVVLATSPVTSFSLAPEETSATE